MSSRSMTPGHRSRWHFLPQPRSDAVRAAAAMVCVILGLGATAAWATESSQRCEMLYSKGLARLHAGDTAAAEQLFDAAVQADPGDAHALYYRGTARGRLGDYAGAERDLRAALERDPSLDQAALDLGYVLFKQGRYDEADVYLRDARARPGVSAQAEVLLGSNDDMRAAAETGRRYRLYARVGFEYDSNVALAPSDDALRSLLLAGSGKSDGRMVADAAAAYSLYASEKVSVAVRYNLTQSVHFDLSEFNMQNHRLSTDVEASAGPVKYGITSMVGYSINDGSKFMLESSVVPWLRVLEQDFGHIDVYYRLWARDLLEQPLSRLSDSTNNAVGLRQFVYLGRPDRYLLAGYRYEHEEPEHSAGAPFGYDGHQFEAGLGWTLVPGLRGQATYAFENEDYEKASDGRNDEQHSLWLRAEKDLTDWATVVAGYALRVNDSNKPAFEYNRQIASLTIELSY